jgi:xanthine/uracil/vitamin C permease (AzgA family)
MEEGAEPTKNDVIDMAQARPERKLVENPLTWWGDTPWCMWNFNYGGILGLWAGVGEAEALGELFFDNLATLLSVTDLILGYFLNVVTRGAGEAIAEGYGEAIRSRYQDLYYQRCIPGVAVGLLFGNFYYAYMAGRLALKEKRDDVTAQPYGINTTGAFITLSAINLEALLSCVGGTVEIGGGVLVGTNKYAREALAGNPGEAGREAAEKAFAMAVAANFITGLFEILGCVFAEPIRAILPAPAYYSLLTGVGFVFLAFKPMYEVAAEPIVCLVPLLVVVCGFFGGVKYKIGNTGLTIPIAVVAILLSVIFGWAGGCKHKREAAAMYDYGDGSPGNKNLFGDGGWSTCTGTSEHDVKYMYDTYAGNIDALGGGIFSDIGYGMSSIVPFMGTVLVVAVVGFAASLASCESASAAGDDYPMAETLIIDGIGTCLGACFGSFYGTTVYIGHPVHKALGARRGYSAINGMLYFVLLWSGLFASLYKSIPGCAASALLIFVGLLICRQAIEDNPPDYYPAIFFGLFPCLCNWAALRVQPGAPWDGGGWWNGAGSGRGAEGMGINFMGQGGGEWFTLIMTSIFCYCTDRNFKAGAIMCAVATLLQLLTGIPTLYNAETAPKGRFDGIARMGKERMGYYPKKPDDGNFSWMWAVAFAMCTGFFLIQFALQRAGMIDPPIVREKPGGPAKAAVPDAKTDIVEA